MTWDYVFLVLFFVLGLFFGLDFVSSSSSVSCEGFSLSVKRLSSIG